MKDNEKDIVIKDKFLEQNDRNIEDFQTIKDFFLDLKQSSFYLSYAEELYLDHILKKKVPKEVIISGIEKYMYRLPEFKRRKAMLFMCDSDINASITDFIRRMWANSDEYWYIGRFDLHIKRLKYTGLDKKYNINLDKIPYPTTEEEAASTLNRIKKQIFEKEWDLLSQETKSMILQKYEKFKKFPELYDKMIMDHVLHVLNLDWIDLYTLS
ncbi:MAG: hypothetical protein RXN95_06650 [Hydrogenobaculum sp.]|jgi:SRSO17 transposase